MKDKIENLFHVEWRGHKTENACSYLAKVKKVVDKRFHQMQLSAYQSCKLDSQLLIRTRRVLLKYAENLIGQVDHRLQGCAHLVTYCTLKAFCLHVHLL